jgi:pilus assembly protein Flp/PilA
MAHQHDPVVNRKRSKSMVSLFRSAIEFLRNEDGPTAVEYGVVLALILMVCVIAITALGTSTNGSYQKVGAQVGKTGS